MTDKKDQEENFKQFIQKHSIRKEEVSKAPPPITPVGGGYGVTLPRPQKTESQKEHFKRITGTDLMKRWSVGWEAIFHFAEQENLIPYKPEPEELRRRVKYDFGMLSDYSPEEREEYFSQWWYHPNNVEAFEAQHGKIIDDWRKEVVSSEPQAPGATKVIIEESKNEQFVFKKSIDGWRMVFNGEDFGHLTDIGFAYMHYCMEPEREGKDISSIDLENEVKPAIRKTTKTAERQFDNEHQTEEEDEQKSPNQNKKVTTDHRAVLDEQAITDILKEKKRLEVEIEQLEDRDDTPERNILIKEQQDKLEAIQKQLSDCA